MDVNGMAFVLRESQVYPLEINPRYCASMELIEQACGLSIFDLHVQTVTEGNLPDFDLMARLGSGSFHGKGILYAERDCLAPDTHPWLQWGIKDVPFPGEILTKGKPVCTVLAHGATRETCYTRLVAQTDALKRERYA